MPLKRKETSISRTFKVYDADKQKLIYTFDSSVKAGEVLGLNPKYIITCANGRHVNKTNKLGLRIAIR